LSTSGAALIVNYKHLKEGTKEKKSRPEVHHHGAGKADPLTTNDINEHYHLNLL